MRGMIGFDHYKIRCIIGVNPEERIQEQDIFLDLRVETDFAQCALSDSLEETIDYDRLAALCRELAQKGKYHLMETFAYNLLQAIFNQFNVAWASVKIKKPLDFPLQTYNVVELRAEHPLNRGKDSKWDGH